MSATSLPGPVDPNPQLQNFRDAMDSIYAARSLPTPLSPTQKTIAVAGLMIASLAAAYLAGSTAIAYWASSKVFSILAANVALGHVVLAFRYGVNHPKTEPFLPTPLALFTASAIYFIATSILGLEAVSKAPIYLNRIVNDFTFPSEEANSYLAPGMLATLLTLGGKCEGSTLHATWRRSLAVALSAPGDDPTLLLAWSHAAPSLAIESNPWTLTIAAQLGKMKIVRHLLQTIRDPAARAKALGAAWELSCKHPEMRSAAEPVLQLLLQERGPNGESLLDIFYEAKLKSAREEGIPIEEYAIRHREIGLLSYLLVHHPIYSQPLQLQQLSFPMIKLALQTLHDAAPRQRGECSELALFKALMEHADKLNLEARDLNDPKRSTLLMHCVANYPELAHYLVENGAPLDTQDAERKTALDYTEDEALKTSLQQIAQDSAFRLVMKPLKAEVRALPAGDIGDEALQGLLVKLITSPGIGNLTYWVPIMNELLEHLNMGATPESIVTAHRRMASLLATSQARFSQDHLYQFCQSLAQREQLSNLHPCIAYQALEQFCLADIGEEAKAGASLVLSQYLDRKAAQLIRGGETSKIFAHGNVSVQEIYIAPNVWFGVTSTPFSLLVRPVMPDLLVEALWRRIQYLRDARKDIPTEVQMYGRSGAELPRNFTLPLAKLITNDRIFLYHANTVSRKELNSHYGRLCGLGSLTDEEAQALEECYRAGSIR